MSPTQRTLAWLREQGYAAQVVERWEPHSRRRIDLFGCIDIIAISDFATIGVQATSVGGMSDRFAKIRGLPGAWEWLNSAHWSGHQRRLWIVGWRKYKKPLDGKFWRAIVREVTIADLRNVEGDDATAREANQPA